MSNLNNNTTQLEALLAKVNALPEAGGTDTSDATAAAEEIFAGKTAYIAEGKVTGTFTIEEELTEQNDLISQIATLVATKATPSGTDTSDATATAGDILSGKTAYVRGSKITGNIAFQPAQTITPGIADKTIDAGKYLTGAQTIKGDANLVASNIVSGKSIFGVVGTATTGGGSGGDTSMEDSLVTRTVTTYTNDRITSIGSYAFYNCTNLTSINTPQVTTIAFCAFMNCRNLASANFPQVTSIGFSAFSSCANLTSISFPQLTSIAGAAFYSCANLTSVSFPQVTYIASYAFSICSKLTSIYLGASSLCTLQGSNAFSRTGITSRGGSIFVRASLVNAYKSATNWAYFSNRIFAYDFT